MFPDRLAGRGPPPRSSLRPRRVGSSSPGSGYGCPIQRRLSWRAPACSCPVATVTLAQGLSPSVRRRTRPHSARRRRPGPGLGRWSPWRLGLPWTRLLGPQGRAVGSSFVLQGRPLPPTVLASPPGCPRAQIPAASTWALVARLVSPSAVRPVQVGTPNWEVEKVTTVGLPLFRGWVVERGLQGWGGQGAAQGRG